MSILSGFVALIRSHQGTKNWLPPNAFTIPGLYNQHPIGHQGSGGNIAVLFVQAHVVVFDTFHHSLHLGTFIGFGYLLSTLYLPPLTGKRRTGNGGR